MQDIQFADPAGAAAQGLAQGVSQGIQLGMQARELAWQKKYQKAAVAMQIATTKGMPESMRLAALNNGIRPLLQDKRFGLGNDIPEFTAESLKNPVWENALNQIKTLNSNSDVSESMKLKGTTTIFRDAFIAMGEEDKAASLQNSLMTLEGQTAQRVPTSLEGLAVEQVKAGKLSLKDAYEMKSPDRPTPPSPEEKELAKVVANARVQLAQTRPVVENSIKEIDRVIKLNSDSYGGKVGELQMKVERLTDSESKMFKNTADVINTMQSQVAAVLKSTFGGQLSDGERAYLNEVYGALPGMAKAEREIAMNNVKTMLSGRLRGAESKLSELQGGVTAPTNSSTSATKPKTVVQNGYTYTLNEATGQYE